MYVYCVYVLCIYKYTHIQYIFWKYLIYKHSIFFLNTVYTVSHRSEYTPHIFVNILYWTKLKMQHFCFCPHELKDLRLFLCTQKAYFSQILFTNLSKSVLVNEIIHPPLRCGISRCWLDRLIIAQVCLRLATIRGRSKMCSETHICPCFTESRTRKALEKQYLFRGSLSFQLTLQDLTDFYVERATAPHYNKLSFMFS